MEDKKILCKEFKGSNMAEYNEQCVDFCHQVDCLKQIDDMSWLKIEDSIARPYK